MKQSINWSKAVNEKREQWCRNCGPNTWGELQVSSEEPAWQLRLWHHINEVGVLRLRSGIIIHLLLYHHHHLKSPSNQHWGAHTRGLSQTAWALLQMLPQRRRNISPSVPTSAPATTFPSETETEKVRKKRIFFGSCCGRSRIEDWKEALGAVFITLLLWCARAHLHRHAGPNAWAHNCWNLHRKLCKCKKGRFYLRIHVTPGCPLFVSHRQGGAQLQA